MIRVQREDFDIGAEIARLKAGRSDIGAIVTFTGTVRDQDGAVAAMTLEHYPGMTEAELSSVEAEACARCRFRRASSCIATARSSPATISFSS